MFYFYFLISFFLNEFYNKIEKAKLLNLYYNKFYINCYNFFQESDCYFTNFLARDHDFILCKIFFL